MANPIFAAILVLTSLVLAPQDALSQKDDAKHSNSTLRFAVTNTSNAPIGDVEIEVLKWTGKLESFGALGKTNSEGKVTIEVPFSEDYYYLKFLCRGYASGQRALQLSRGESQIDFKLSRPVQGSIKLTADGKQLAGAEFSFFEITDANKGKSYLDKAIAETFGLKMNVSDAQGRLELPQLPIGANLQFTIVHPEFKTVKLTDLIASTGQIAEVNLEPGVRVTIDLGADVATKNEIEGKLAKITLLSNGKPSRDATSLIHSFPVRDGKVKFTAFPMEYQELRFELDRYFVSPMLVNRPQFPNKEFDFAKKTEASFHLALHPQVKARGRVVDV